MIRNVGRLTFVSKLETVCLEVLNAPLKYW